MKQSYQKHRIEKFEYDDDGFLGQGSFGKVYKGVNTETNDIVAIKIMDMSLFTDQFMIDSLKTEIKVMKELQSPYIVRMFDAFGDIGQTIIVLELCDEGDLRKYLEQNNGMLDEEHAVLVLKDLMGGFKEMVKHNYIHRDIKPENALIKQNKFKVADFGFATKVDISGRQMMKECVGTPLYMAPQLLKRQQYSAKSDVWSIGILAFELIYGRQPWPCRDCNSYLYNIMNQPLKFPYEKNRKISQEYKDLIKQCLAVDESQRIGWGELFNHPGILLDLNKRNYVDQTADVDQHSRRILKEIQNIVHVRNINVAQIFQQFDSDKGGYLDPSEFIRLINYLDQRVTLAEAQHLFKQFDKNGDGALNLDELKRILCEIDFSDLQDKACKKNKILNIFTARIILDLKEIIKANKLNIKQIFSNFDTDKQGDLDMKEFTKLIKVIAPAIKDQEINEIFKKFDKNNDGGISYDEFRKELAYGIPDQDSKFDPQLERVNKMVSELRRIVQQNQLDVTQIFKNFDKNRTNSLDFLEFQKLCQVMDNTLGVEEQKQVFQRFDENQDGQIMLDEFKKLFLP